MDKKYRADMNVDQITEHVNTLNVLAAIDYTKSTRELIDEQWKQIDWLTREVGTLRSEVQNMTMQVGMLRGQVLGGGPTG